MDGTPAELGLTRREELLASWGPTSMDGTPAELGLTRWEELLARWY
jgi:hypothetical protein